MKPRISFYTFGCRLNQAETAIIRQTFEQDGYEVVDYREPADVVVVNTCTVTENGDADTRRLVNKINRMNPAARIALVGCQAQVQREKLLEMPNVHWVVGNAKKMELREILQQSGLDSPQVITPVIPRESFTLPIAGVDSQHTRVNLKIQDGCDFFCSFCEIPYARGRARSRKFQDILKEVRVLIAAGHHELVLTGINIGTYTDGDKTLIDLLNALEKIEDLWRIRISSIEPTTIPESIIQKMAMSGKLCRYLHVPLQSGCNAILRAMNRRYSVQEFIEFLTAVHHRIPDICLGTDIIVGFPGETEQHFEETYELLRGLPLAYFHVFSYSERAHARSGKYVEKVSRDVIMKRSLRLRELSSWKRRLFYEKFIGRNEWVLFEQEKNGFWMGLTDNYVRVKVESDLTLKNRLLPVRLDRIDHQTLIGTLQ